MAVPSFDCLILKKNGQIGYLGSGDQVSYNVRINKEEGRKEKQNAITARL